MNANKSRTWRMSAPTDGQLSLLARHGVDAPENATRGEISDMLDWLAAEGTPHPRFFEPYGDDDDDDDFNDHEVDEDGEEMPF